MSYSIAVDSAGGSYIAGYFNSTNVSFGNLLLTNSSPTTYDVFIAKYDPNGAVIWARRMGGTNDDRARSIAVDAQHNCYVTGRFVSTNFSIGGITLTNYSPNGNSSIFVAKFDASGNLLWARSPDRGYDQSGWQVTADGIGNCYVTGSFRGTNTFAGTNLISRGLTDVLLLKYDPHGNLLWVQQAGGNDTDTGTALALDASGNAYLLANFRSTNATFGNFLFSVNGNDTVQNMVVAKYNSVGNVIWAKQFGGTDIDAGNGIVVDRFGNCSITGDFRSTNLVFGDISLTKSAFGFTDIFVAKLNPDGDALWAKAGRGEYTDSSMGIAVDFAGNSYIAGFFQSSHLVFDALTLTNTEADLLNDADAFIAKFDSYGELLWGFQPIGTNEQRAFSIAVDSVASVYITGWTQGTNVLFGTFAATNAYLDSFVTKIDSDYPLLQIATTNSTVVISWPARKAGFTPEVTGDFQTWTPVAGTILTNNGRNVVTNDISGSKEFFRLKKPN